ncbi:reverse transcriptase domain-containing protein [Tanacetum coccineum]
MLERLAGNEFYCFLDGFSGYFQILINPQDQEKTTFTCPYGTFAYRRMPFGLCNAPGTFQRCMVAIFHNMIKKTMEVFMDDFSVFGDSFSSCHSHLDMMLKRCEDTNLVLNWEKCHFMVMTSNNVTFIASFIPYTAYPAPASPEYAGVRYKEFGELIQPFKHPERVSQLVRKLLKTTGLDCLSFLGTRPYY